LKLCQFTPVEQLRVITNAPKSVSLQALLFEDQRLIEAHRRATEIMLRLLEERYAMTRIRKSGERLTVQTEKLIIAQFHHVTSRSVDPHLHSHNLILNMTRRPDNRWSSLSNTAIYANKMLLGKLYLNELAQAVQAMGYAIKLIKGKQGMWELAGMTRAQLEQFSKRSQQIEAAVGTDADSKIKASAAMFSGRARKQQTSIPALKASWQQQARAVQLALIIPQPQSIPTVPSDPRIAAFHHTLNQHVFEVVLQGALEQCLRKSGRLKREDIESAVLTLAMGEYPFAAIATAVEQPAVLDQILIHNLTGGYDRNASHVFYTATGRRGEIAEPGNSNPNSAPAATVTRWHSDKPPLPSARSDSEESSQPTSSQSARYNQFPHAGGLALSSESASSTRASAADLFAEPADSSTTATPEAFAAESECNSPENRRIQSGGGPGDGRHQNSPKGDCSGRSPTWQGSVRHPGAEVIAEAACIEQQEQEQEWELER
jgi:conjugative relaxase-like TrwC/TraI family protein